MKDMSKSMKLISSCAYIDTLSFRATSSQMITTTSSPSSSSTTSFSSMWDDPIESVISGLTSERFFFDPKESCSLVLDQHEQSSTRDKKNNPNPNPNLNLNLNPEPVGEVVYKESEALCMESNNPCEDFRRSMEEMVEAHGLNDWHGLEQLLGCYLKLNDKVNHSYIMGAFIDLLVNHHHSFVSSSTTTTSTSTSTSSSNSLSSTNLNCSSPSSPLSLPSSSLTTPCLSSLLDHDDDGDEEEEEVNNGDVNHDDANDGAGDRQYNVKP